MKNDDLRRSENFLKDKDYKRKKFKYKKGKKKFFKKDDTRIPTYTNNPKYFGKEIINNSSGNDGRKKFNFKKGKKRFKNRSRPKTFKFKKFRKNRN